MLADLLLDFVSILSQQLATQTSQNPLQLSLRLFLDHYDAMSYG